MNFEDNTKPSPVEDPKPAGDTDPGQTIRLEQTTTPAIPTPHPPETHPVTTMSTDLSGLSLRYDILGEVGRGGMGIVYKARDRETGEVVALKLLKPEIAADQTMTEKFKNELLLARKITHKNVCRVHEFNRVGSIAYTSMEYVEGESLRSMLRRLKKFPVRKGVVTALQICAGLREAHEQKIIHRDLKPENVMLDSMGNVKLMDFGISRSLESTAKLTGSLVGTPAYMAPEQVAGKPLDYRSDLYSVGLILYEIVTGKPPFEAENPVAVALKQMSEQPVPPHVLDPTIPVWLEKTILKCIEKDAEQRFQSIDELEKALRSQGAFAPASAPSVPLASVNPFRAAEPEKPIRKKKSAIFAWAFVLAVLVAIATVVVQNKEEKKLKGAFSAIAAQNTSRMSAPVAQPGAVAPASAAPPSATDGMPAAASGASQPSAPQADAPAAPRKPENTKGGKEPSALPETTSPDASNAGSQEKPTYLWVGRFMREDRAQEVSQELTGAGVPVITVPKQGLRGQVYVVFAGPFRGLQWVKIAEKLEANGFKNIRPVTNPYAQWQGDTEGGGAGTNETPQTSPR